MSERDVKQLRFVTSNQHKIAEAAAILAPHGINVLGTSQKIEELQTQATEALVRDKALSAFRKIGRPLFVEHTGLYIEYLQGLPGGLTQLFWDSLEADRFSELFGERSPNPATIARTTVAYCDGRGIHIFEGEIAGKIVPEPRGNREFQWDCVFQPNGCDQTFAEMGEYKNKISMRKLALDSLAKHLAGERR